MPRDLQAPDASISDALRSIGADELGSDSSPEAKAAVLDRLPSLRDELGSATRWEVAVQEFERILRECGVPAPRRMIQAALNGSDDVPDSGLQGSSLSLEDPEPLRGPIALGDVLKELEEAFVRHVALPEGASVALALWVMLAATHDSWSVSPILAAVSPRSGVERRPFCTFFPPSCPVHLRLQTSRPQPYFARSRSTSRP